MLLGEKPRKPPQVDVAPPAVDFAAGVEALEIAELAGLALDDWQQYVLLRSMGRDEGGRWAAFETGLVVGRQAGKSEILVARMLSDLFTELSDPRLTLYSAHHYKTAREIFLRLRFLLDPPKDADPLLFADPVLLDQVKTMRTSNGEESVELHNGRRVRFVARTSGSGRGFVGDTVLLDEAYDLVPDELSALLYTMGARPNPQLWYASMGPFDKSEKLLEIMERARSDSPGRLCYLGWEVPADESVEDRDWWVATQPAHPHRMSFETLENEFKADPLGFAREKLCMRTSVSDPAVPPELWVPAQDPSAVPVPPFAFGFDVSVDRDTYAICVSDGKVVELVESGPFDGSVTRIRELCEEHGSLVGVHKFGPAGSLIDKLDGVVEFSNRDLAEACARFYDLFPDIRVREHEGLTRAVGGAVKKTVGDAWVWSRRSSNVDVTPLLAAVLAVEVVSRKPVRSVYETRDLVVV